MQNGQGNFINEDKKDHDNETDNKEFIDWENRCIEEVTRLK